MIIGNTNSAVNSEPFIQDIPTMTQGWKAEVCRLGSLVGTDAKKPKEDLIKYVESLLELERNAVLNRAWEYVVKASREEQGSKVDFIKFIENNE